MFGKLVQSWPQVPQFLGSDLRSTQLEAHMSLVGAVQSNVHTAVAPFAEHSGVAAGQIAPQAPQFCESRRFVSHPSSARTVQCEKPCAHAVVGT
jgi:hypothetical protein